MLVRLYGEKVRLELDADGVREVSEKIPTLFKVNML